MLNLPRISCRTPKPGPALFTLLLTLWLAHPTVGRAALGDHLYSWGVSAGGISAVDSNGNVVAAGSFFAPTDFGGGVFTPANIFAGDMFVARFDDNGAHLWSQQFTPTGFGGSIDAIAVGPAGEVYLGGTLQNGGVDFGGGAMTGAGELFVAAFDASGNHLWSRTAGQGSLRGVAADANGVCFTGLTYGTVDFGGGPLSSSGGSDLFVSRLSGAGTHQWTKVLGDGAGQAGLACALDSSGNVLLVGATEGSVDFGGGALAPAGTAGLCLAKYDSAGVHQWSQLIDGRFTAGAGVGWQMEIDVAANDDFVIGGEFQNSVDFGGGVLTSAGSSDAFVAVFDSGGAHQWSSGYGSTKSEIVQGVAFDPSGNLMVSGTFLSTGVSFGGGSFSPSGFGSDFFVALYDVSGAHQWSTSFGNNGQYAMTVDSDPSGNLVLSGTAVSGLDLGGGALTDANFFVAELEGNGGVTAAPQAARPYVWLGQNSPNPFNPRTRIDFRVEESTRVLLTIHDLRGRLVRTLLAGSVEAGDHSLSWSGRDANGRAVASGVYLLRLEADGSVLRRRMALAK